MKKSTMIALVCVLVFSVLLCGCSERIKENMRISKDAKRHAKPLAVAYIKEKYGIKATAAGYSIEGNDAFMAFENSTKVIVAMTYEEEPFCVYLDLERENFRYDNRQGQQVASVLETYFLEQLGFPAPVYSKLKFWTWGIGYDSASSFTVDGVSYDINRMLDFAYDGQSAKELLEQMKIIEYEGNFVQPGFSMEAVEFDPALWPMRDQAGIFSDNVHFSANLFLLSDKGLTAEDLTSRRLYHFPSRWKGVREYLGLDFVREEGTPIIERNFQPYNTAEISGISFVGMSPLDPAVCIKTSDEKRVWRVEDQFYDNGNGHTKTEISEYEQVTPLLSAICPDDLWEEAVNAGLQDSMMFAGFAAQSYLDQYGEDLYVASYSPDTQEFEIDQYEKFFPLFLYSESEYQEKTYAQRALLHLKSRETVEVGKPA